jgi:hypothetical protein
VNIAMTAIAASVLLIVLAAYSILTLLPVRYLDCPYHTPLSGAFWRLFRAFPTFWHHRHPQSDAANESGSFDATIFKPHSSDDETMVQAMSRTAMGPSEERSERDSQALIWAVKSLADDTELEPFVAAIPDLLWGPTRRRY